MRKLASLLLVTGLSLVSASPALAARSVQSQTPASTVAPAANAANWLAGQVTPDGYIESAWTPGTADDGTTAQAVIALAAAGLGRTQVDAMEAYLAAHVETVVQSGGVDSPQRLALLILGAVASGRQPTSFGGVNLVTRLQATLQPSGLYGSASATYDGAFRQGLSLLALHAVGVAPPSAATDWLLDQQCANGGWQSLRTDTSVPCAATDPASFSGPDTNSTAMATMALTALGIDPTADVATWFAAVRTGDGGWANFSTPTEVPDANSTGLVLQALYGLTGALDDNGVASLLRLQVACTSTETADRGGVAFQADPGDGSLIPDALATSQAIWGLAGVAFPVPATDIAPVGEVCPPAPTTTTTVPPASTSTTVGQLVVGTVPPPPANVYGEELPRTGASILGMDASEAALFGAFAVLLGATLVVAARRRRIA